jgi:hypothetical protein
MNLNRRDAESAETPENMEPRENQGKPTAPQSCIGSGQAWWFNVFSFFSALSASLRFDL